ncbi:MAG: imidazolonepropionase [Deltaproteobacteria bacterium]|nr:imidazolonepropionase [Deltaproteobacteria bacterium]
MTLIRNATVMTCDPQLPGLGLLERAAIRTEGPVITWIGKDLEMPPELATGATIDAGGRLVTPGLVDCHTHAIFAGDRADEFAMRAAGATYLEIAAAGGGIRASTGPTRAASDEQLIALLHDRLDTTRAAGTTSIEVKTGYDLTVAGELRLLRCIAAAAATSRSRVVPTLLAHLIPAERAADRDAYVRSLCTELIPEAGRARLATSVDVYCDEGAYTLAETRAILEAARAAGLAVRAHVGQFADLGGAELLAEFGGLSADHLEQVSATGIAALAAAGVVAVMLPGACVQLRLPVPPVAALRAAGVRLAIGSDLNPGSSYCESLAIPMWLATTHFAMTVEEAWLGVTRHAAAALAIDAGTLTVGGPADLVLWRCTNPADVPYRYGSDLVDQVFSSRG